MMHVSFFLQQYGIQGFPTIKVFLPGKPPVDYQGGRDVKAIANFALSQVSCSKPYLSCKFYLLPLVGMMYYQLHFLMLHKSFMLLV
jgi:hypothetical protein